MKLKNIGFFRQHLEKLVLAVGVLFLLIVAAWTFVGNPYAVEISGERMSPRKAEEHLVERAGELEHRLRNDDRLETLIRQREIPSYAQVFEQQMNEDVIDMSQYRLALGLPGIAESTFVPPEAPDPYFVPRPDMPVGVNAVASYGVLGQVDDRNVQEQLDRFVLDQETRDFRYVSVTGFFDMEAYAQRFQQTPPEGYQQLPQTWWQPRLRIAGVYLQREEQDPVTSEWGDRRIVDPLPTQIAYGYAADESRDSEALISHIQENQRRIVQPAFVPMEGSRAWEAPGRGRRELNADEQRRVNEISQEIESIRQRTERWEQVLRRQGITPPSERMGQQDGNDQRDPADFWGDPAAPGDDQDLTPSQQNMIRRIERDLERERELERERDELYGINPDASQDEEDGDADRDMGVWMEDGFAGRNTGNDDEALPRGEIQVWAHDLSVRPGRTYRYRVIVTTLNPLYQRNRLAPEQFDQFFDQVALHPGEETLAAADWSRPVKLDPEFYFFLVDGLPAAPEAKVEVWRLYRGQWRFHEFDVRPGDIIGGEAVIDDRTVPMRVNSVLIDLLAVADGPGGGRGSRMIYFDRQTNRILERLTESDRDSNDRIRLRNELRRGDERSAARE